MTYIAYAVSRKVVSGLKLVVEMENNITMPAVENVLAELTFLNQLLNDSESYYGVPFRVQHTEHKAIVDIKHFLEEYYFGERTRKYHEFRFRPLFRLVLEPLLDDFSNLSHDEVLDCADAAIEQLKEYALMMRAPLEKNPDIAPAISEAAYETYLNMVSMHHKDREITRIARDIWKLHQSR